MARKPKMGFEKNRRLRKEYKNKPEIVEFDGKTCAFRSQLEKKIAYVLELQKQSGDIADWGYETTLWTFPDDQWLVDFTVTENDKQKYYIEAKGYFEARDRKKLKMLYKYYPNERLLYIMQNKCDIKRLKTSAKYLWWRDAIALKEFTNEMV
jgi:hypothetical protein